MDSGNSGSLQSSSGGGDDEFDSRCGGGGGADSSPLSALLRPPPPAPMSFYGLRQELATAAAPPMSHSHWSSTPLPGAGAGGGASHADHVAAASAAQQQQQQAAPRGSRKRMRASRRAPTTVLTTDTSNFRAMVQEFTGIPAPPFAAASSSARSSRFDHLFPSRSSYLLRPFAHKLPAPSSYPPAFITATPSTSSPASANISVATSTAAPNQLAGGGGNYLSFQQSAIGAQPDGRYPANAHHMFDAAGEPQAQRLPDTAGFIGHTHHLHGGDHGYGGDELSGLVGAASVPGSDGCKAAAYSSAAGSASRAAPLLERNARTNAGGATMTPAAAMSTQAMESWICTSE